MKPVLFVAGHAPPDRVGAFARLHESEDVEFALFGGRLKHGVQIPGQDRPRDAPASSARADRSDDLPFPHRHVRQHDLLALAGSGSYRAVICHTGGRVAPLAIWAGTRRARVPLILWASLWAHPRSAAHALSYLPLRHLYRSADAVVTYGPHVSAYVSAKGARNIYIAPQAVDNDFWSSPALGAPSAASWPQQSSTKFLFAGRPAPEKGLEVLIEAWGASGLQAPTAALVLLGVGSALPWVSADSDGAAGALCLEPVGALELRNFYAAADVLVLPSIPTRTFQEPWGLVVNEAFNQHLPVLVSDAVGAAAGGLVRDGHNGLVVPAGEVAALASALRRLALDAPLRARLGATGASDVRAYNYDAWAEGFSRALHSLGISRRRW